MAKTMTYDFRAFMNGKLVEKTKEQSPVMFAAGLGASIAFGGFHPVAAADMTTRIISAFNPIISLVQGIAYPVTFLMISGGTCSHP